MQGPNPNSDRLKRQRQSTDPNRTVPSSAAYTNYFDTNHPSNTAGRPFNDLTNLRSVAPIPDVYHNTSGQYNVAAPPFPNSLMNTTTTMDPASFPSFQGDYSHQNNAPSGSHHEAYSNQLQNSYLSHFPTPRMDTADPLAPGYLSSFPVQGDHSAQLSASNASRQAAYSNESQNPYLSPFPASFMNAMNPSAPGSYLLPFQGAQSSASPGTHISRQGAFSSGMPTSYRSPPQQAWQYGPTGQLAANAPPLQASSRFNQEAMSSPTPPPSTSGLPHTRSRATTRPVNPAAAPRHSNRPAMVRPTYVPTRSPPTENSSGNICTLRITASPSKTDPDLGPKHIRRSRQEGAISYRIEGWFKSPESVIQDTCASYGEFVKKFDAVFGTRDWLSRIAKEKQPRDIQVIWCRRPQPSVGEPHRANASSLPVNNSTGSNVTAQSDRDLYFVSRPTAVQQGSTALDEGRSRVSLPVTIFFTIHESSKKPLRYKRAVFPDMLDKNEGAARFFGTAARSIRNQAVGGHRSDDGRKYMVIDGSSQDSSGVTALTVKAVMLKGVWTFNSGDVSALLTHKQNSPQHQSTLLQEGGFQQFRKELEALESNKRTSYSAPLITTVPEGQRTLPDWVIEDREGTETGQNTAGGTC